LGDDGVKGFASVLFFNTSLLCVSLARNRITDIGAKALAAALSRYLLNEQETAIVEKFMNDESKQRISDEGGGLVKRRKGQKAPIKRGVTTRQSVKRGSSGRRMAERSLNFDPSAPVAAVVLAKWNICITLDNGQKAIPGNATITSLILDENAIGEVGLNALKEMLVLNRKIVQFSIECNPEISSDMAEWVARKLPVSVAQT
jgi:hypothetical protein